MNKPDFHALPAYKLISGIPTSNRNYTSQYEETALIAAISTAEFAGHFAESVFHSFLQEQFRTSFFTVRYRDWLNITYVFREGSLIETRLCNSNELTYITKALDK